jgi:hypothetical protein
MWTLDFMARDWYYNCLAIYVFSGSDFSDST